MSNTAPPNHGGRFVEVMFGHTSYSLNSLKGGYIRDYLGDYYRVIKGDARSLDNGSYIPAAQLTCKTWQFSARCQGYKVQVLLEIWNAIEPRRPTAGL